MTDVENKYTVYLDRFTVGLDDLTPEQQGDVAEVLRVLEKAGRYSVFEATDNEIIANTLVDLEKNEMIVSERDHFPWLNVTLTGKAKAFLLQQPINEANDAD